MSMSRKHFQALADCIKSLPVSEEVRSVVASRMADTLKVFNPSFNRDRFLRACGVSQ